MTRLGILGNGFGSTHPDTGGPLPDLAVKMRKILQRRQALRLAFPGIHPDEKGRIFVNWLTFLKREMKMIRLPNPLQRLFLGEKSDCRRMIESSV
jgi:hypothetical protein